jgi:hypothetical protein
VRPEVAFWCVGVGWAFFEGEFGGFGLLFAVGGFELDLMVVFSVPVFFRLSLIVMRSWPLVILVVVVRPLTVAVKQTAPRLLVIGRV